MRTVRLAVAGVGNCAMSKKEGEGVHCSFPGFKGFLSWGRFREQVDLMTDQLGNVPDEAVDV